MAIVVAEAYLIVNGAFLLLFISICLQHQAFYHTIRHSLSIFNHRNGECVTNDFFRQLIEFIIMVKE